MTSDGTQSEVLDLAMSVGGHLAKFVTTAVALLSVAYVLGWVWAESYFARFGAEWLLPKMPAPFFLRHSVYALLMLGWQLVFVIASANRLGLDKWVKSNLFIPVTGLVGLSSIATFFTTNTKTLTVLWVIYFVMGCIFAATMFGELMIVFRYSNRRWTLLLFFGATLGSFVLVTAVAGWGRAEGIRDSDTSRSQLPLVTLADGKSARLLYADGDTLYVVTVGVPGVKLVSGNGSTIVAWEKKAIPRKDDSGIFLLTPAASASPTSPR